MTRRRGTVAVLVLVAGASLAGCVIDPARLTVTVHNESGTELTVSHRGEHLRTVPAGASRDVVLGRGDACREWVLEAATADGVVVATRDAPVCDGDEWTIEEDVSSS